MEPSSLQQAASVARIEIKNGGFESSFETRLDLSEFSMSTGVASSSGIQRASAGTSASAALLMVKALEMQRKEREEKDESQMRDLVERRRKAIVQRAANRKGDEQEEDGVVRVAPPSAASSDEQSSGFLNLGKGSLASALVGMHASDRKDPRAKLKREKPRSARGPSNSRRGKGTVTVASFKGKVAKKWKRSKY